MMKTKAGKRATAAALKAAAIGAKSKPHPRLLVRKPIVAATTATTTTTTTDPAKMDLKTLKQLKPIKNLLLGDRSKGVMLLEHGVVAKSYDRSSNAQIGRFNKEILILQRLKGCKYVPKLFGVDEPNKTLYMEFVGKNLPLSRQQKLEVNKALRHLGERYHVFRMKSGLAKFSYRDLFHANICVDGSGNIKLIDFGSSLWQIHDKSFKTYLSH